MRYNGALLAQARKKLAAIRENNQTEQLRRTDEVRERIPALAELDARLREQMVELAGLVIRRDPDAEEAISSLEARNLALQGRRAELLNAAGFPADYTDEIFSCPKCRDTGMEGTHICSCLEKLYNMELTHSLGTLLRCGDECFERFDETLYDDEPDSRGSSPRRRMRMVYDTCRSYADSFGPSSPNLLFRGGTGLGKTFLSACIAREVSQKGFSVAYDSAATALSAFEAQKFSRDGAETETAAERVHSYLSCDLMILDDLGTEMVTSFSVSALYQIVNGRLISGKKTIISTNCTHDELDKKYSRQIVSRLDGEYLLLPFAGRDIRLIKKERGE